MYFTYYRQQIEGGGTDEDDSSSKDEDDIEILVGDRGIGIISVMIGCV